jgi:hypothetical protein
VEAYKANIKAQLTRKGLIRGQPRASLLQAQANLTPQQQNGRPQAYHRFSAPADTSSPASSSTHSSSLQLDHDFGFGYNFVDQRQNLLPGVAGQYCIGCYDRT